jgi:hypothetical protein
MPPPLPYNVCQQIRLRGFYYTRSRHDKGRHELDTSVLLGAPGGQGGKARHEEVEAREGDHVDSQLAQVSIQLPREPVHISIYNSVR